MDEVNVSPADVQEAARFLQAVLTERIPDGDFTEGSPAYDFAIQGISIAFAYLRKRQDEARASQSLLTVGQLPTSQAVTDAVDAVLANLFRTRTGGKFASGTAVLHFSQRVDALIARTTRFRKTASLVYYLNAPTDLFVPASALTAVRGPDGIVVDYTYTVPVIAAEVGEAYNQAAGRFVGVDRFSPFVTYVENTTPLEDGAGTQSNEEFIESSRAAMSLRALINERSNVSVLRELFRDVERVLTVGAGDPEMVRDVVTEVASGLALHVGGHVDIFVRMPVQRVTERAEVGALYARPDGLVSVLRDTSGARDYVAGTGLAAPVAAGDVLVVGAGLPDAPFQYKVVGVRSDELDVAPRTPFRQATDESATPVALTVTIGNNYPAFNNKLATTTSSQLATSRATTRPNRVGLAGRPVYRVARVEIFGAGSALDPWKDPTTDSLVFKKRVNAAIGVAPLPGDELPFRVVVRNPELNQSALAVTEIELGWPGVTLDGLEAEVTFDTLSGFAAVDAFVRSPFDRTAASNTVPRALHPVYLTFNVPYRLAVVADPFRGNVIAEFDEAAVARQLAAFVSGYRSPNVLDQSLLATQARALAGTISAVYPFDVDYELYAPDGRVYRYRTTNRVTVFAGTGDGVALLNPTELGLPSTGYHAALREQLARAGLSDRNLRYFATAADVSFERRG